MKSLLKFASTEDRAKELLEICRKKGYRLLHKNHQEPLSEEIIRGGGFSTNFGGYGSFSRLGLGAKFGSKWEIEGLDIPAHKGFSEVEVCFGSGIEPLIQQALSAFLEKQGACIATGDNAGCDLFVLPDGEDGSQNLLELISSLAEGTRDFITVTVSEFTATIPSALRARKAPTPQAASANRPEPDHSSINGWDPSSIQIETGAMTGLTVVITGTLASMERKEAELLVERAGGNATGLVSGKTNLLVAGDKAGSKLKKAQDLGVAVLDEAAFLERLGIELP